jgi:RNA polymerase sigma factor (sigma-70 family)
LLKESSESEPDVYEKNELSHQIMEGIHMLPEKCRQAFILNYYENLPHKVIAQQMGISVKTVEKHIGKALKVLRKEVILLVILIANY